MELPPILSTYFSNRHLNAILRSALCFSDRTLSETFIHEHSMSLTCTFLNLPMQLIENYVITDRNCKISQLIIYNYHIILLLATTALKAPSLKLQTTMKPAFERIAEGADGLDCGEQMRIMERRY